LYLMEFQTPTVFNHDFVFHHSTFFRPPKIVKILVYPLYIHNNVTMFSLWEISQFWNSVNEDFKLHLHSKSMAFPQYTNVTLGQRKLLRTLD
jgi:hypothetical protein